MVRVMIHRQESGLEEAVSHQLAACVKQLALSDCCWRMARKEVVTGRWLTDESAQDSSPL